MVEKKSEIDLWDFRGYDTEERLVEIHL